LDLLCWRLQTRVNGVQQEQEYQRNSQYYKEEFFAVAFVQRLDALLLSRFRCHIIWFYLAVNLNNPMEMGSFFDGNQQ
jgi:hypothetical protein